MNQGCGHVVFVHVQLMVARENDQCRYTIPRSMDCTPYYIHIHRLIVSLKDTLFVLKENIYETRKCATNIYCVFFVSHRLHATFPVLLYELILTQLMSVIKIFSCDRKLNHVFNYFSTNRKLNTSIVFDRLEVGYGQWSCYILYISSLNLF